MRIDRSRQSDGLPISTGSTLIIRDSRFSLRYDTASSTYTLQVRNHILFVIMEQYCWSTCQKSWSWKCCVQCTELLISHTVYRPLLNNYLRNHHYEDELSALICCLETLLFDLGSKYYNYCCRRTVTNAVCRILICSGKIWFCVMICELSYANIALQMLSSSFFIPWCRVYFP